MLNAHMVQVGPMTENELREAIERPAYLVGCEVEPALILRLLDDVKGQPGALPLLQFALTEVWKKRDVRKLKLRAYEDLGGVEGALEQRADQIFESFPPAKQELCRRLFLRLVQPGEGTEDTKRRVSFRELLPEDPGRAAAMREVIDALAHQQARLVTTDRTDTASGVVEVAHEALIRSWRKLREWIDTDRAGLLTQRRLSEAARQWTEAASDMRDDLLYRGAILAVATEWASGHLDELSSIENAFVVASQEAQRELERKELEREHRLRMAAEDRAAALGEAQRQAALAEQRFHIAEARRLATEARSAMLDHPIRSLILAVEAVKATRDWNEPVVPAAEAMLHELLNYVGGTTLSSHRFPVLSAGFAPDGRLVTAGDDRIVRVWDLKNPQAEPLALLEQEASILSVGFAPDGRLVTAGENGTLRVWDLKDPQAEPLVLRGHERWILAMGISSDGQLVTASQIGTARVWDLKNLQAEPLDLQGHESSIRVLEFAPDGRLVTAGDDRTVRVWDLKNPQAEPLVLRGHERWIMAVGTSSDGRLVTVSGDRTVRVWDLHIDRLIEKADLTAGRDLTREEWQQYFRGQPYRKTFSDTPAPGHGK
jgi:hypothetical protein